MCEIFEMLILEVRKRDVLWDKRSRDYKNRRLVDRAWDEVAKETGLRKEEAKGKWKNLRDIFMREIKKIEQSGDEEESTPVYRGKWSYFEMMTFLTSTLLPRSSLGSFMTDTSTSLSLASGQSRRTTQGYKIELIDALTSRPSDTFYEDDSADADNDLPYDRNDEILNTSDPFDAKHFQEPPPRSDSPPGGFLPTKKRKTSSLENSKLETTGKVERDDEDMNFFKSLVPYMKQLEDVQKLMVRNEFQNILIRELSKNNTRTQID